MDIIVSAGFGDLRRLACGVVKETLDVIAKAHKEEEFMDFIAWCWDANPPKLDGLFQWIALCKNNILERVEIYPDDDEDMEDPEDMDDDEWGVYTRDAEDVYC